MATAVMSLPQPIATASPPDPLMATASTTTRQPYLPLKQFKVKNVDDKGRIIHIGFLEITESHISFQHEHYPAEKLQWPLSCIRKYGNNSKGTLFIIEAGRRAPDGEGMYAFRTKEASEIRKRLDHYSRKF